jgi:membrane fusion protein
MGQTVEHGDPLMVLRIEELRLLADEREGLRRERASAIRQRLELNRLMASKETAAQGTLAELAARLEGLTQELAAGEALERSQVVRHQVTLGAAQERARRLAAEVALEDERVKVAQQLLAESEGIAHLTSKRDLFERREVLLSVHRDRERARRAAVDGESSVADLVAAREVERRQNLQRTAELRRLHAEALASRERLLSVRQTEAAQDRAQGRRLQETIERAEARCASLDRELEGAEGPLLSIRAPYAGTIISLPFPQPGAVVPRGEGLCQIAPRSARWVAELSLPEQESGRLSSGQPVRFLFDAYPHTRYGPRSGELIWVHPSVAGGDCRARATLALHGVAPRAGLSGTARVLTGERTLFQYALDPLRRLREPLTGP